MPEKFFRDHYFPNLVHNVNFWFAFLIAKTNTR